MYFVYLYVCVVLVNSMLWGQNVPSKMAISKIIDLVGTFLVPMRKTAVMFSENLKMQFSVMGSRFRDWG